MNFYSVYRWFLLAITLFNVANVVLFVLEYKRYYDKLPTVLRKYLQEQTVRILGKKIAQNYKELWINLGLLCLLMTLNVVAFIV
ncbi:MAG: hypothetical protein WBB82_06000 [Limnothrix sp.]